MRHTLSLLIIVVLSGCTGSLDTAPASTANPTQLAAASQTPAPTEPPAPTLAITPTLAALQLPIGNDPGYLQIHPTDPLPPSIAFSPRGDILATGYYTQSFIILWDMATGEQIRTLIPPELRNAAGTVEPQNLAGAVGGIAFSPDGSLIAAAYSHLKRVVLWNLATGEFERSLEVENYYLDELKFSPDGKLLAGGMPRIQNSLGTVYLWNTEDWSTLNILHDTAPPFTFSRDSAVLATVSGATPIATGVDRIQPGSVNFWDTSTGHQTNRIRLDGYSVGMDFSSDQNILAVNLLQSAPSGPVALTQLVDSSTGEILSSLEASSEDGEPLKGTRGQAVFSPDGSWLAVRYQPDTIILWSVPKAEQVRTFKDPAGGLSDLTFTPDGKMLAAASSDNRILFWNLPAN